MRRAGAAAIVAAITLTVACGPSIDSQTTSIRDGDCREPAPDLAARYAERELGVQQCPGAYGLDVLVVSSDANSWIELRSSTMTWSSEVPIVYEMPIGLFPGVQDDAPLEWRAAGPELRALLFTVSAQDPEDAETRVRRVFVTRFAEDGRICVIGRAGTLDEARALADRGSACPES